MKIRNRNKKRINVGRIFILLLLQCCLPVLGQVVSPFAAQSVVFVQWEYYRSVDSAAVLSSNRTQETRWRKEEQNGSTVEWGLCPGSPASGRLLPHSSPQGWPLRGVSVKQLGVIVCGRPLPLKLKQTESVTGFEEGSCVNCPILNSSWYPFHKTVLSLHNIRVVSQCTVFLRAHCVHIMCC